LDVDHEPTLARATRLNKEPAMPTPLVSVVIPTYNAAAPLPRAVESVIAQTTSDWELLIVDDGSTDGTAAAIAPYRRALGERLTFIRRRNAGSSVARNTGIDRARGAFIAFLDADDAFEPAKLARQLELFALAPELGLVYCDFSTVNLEGRRDANQFEGVHAGRRPVPTREIAPRLRVCDDTFCDLMVGHYIVSPITAMVRRDVLGTEVRFPPGQQYSEEWLFFLDVAARCQAGYVDEALSIHYHTAGSLSRTDVMRNNIHQARAIERILREHPRATAAARAEARAQLVSCYRQLAFDCHKAGRHHEAAGYFRKVLARQFAWRDAARLAKSCLAGLVAQVARPQDQLTSIGELT
jgi:glycosyltransferase involved in cell wall biosynthesis